MSLSQYRGSLQLHAGIALTVQVSRYAGCESSSGSNCQRSSEINETRKGSPVNRLHSVLDEGAAGQINISNDQSDHFTFILGNGSQLTV